MQDVRLGGLKQRLTNCRTILKEYLEGKIDSIPELEMPVLEYEQYAYNGIITENVL